jgi:predicted NUDIX family NTP pyrophosphohydrolase
LPKQSAGILLYRARRGKLEVLLVHPGGPFWSKKDLGAWSIPKGEFVDGEEDARTAAFRELKEETGWDLNGETIALDPIQQKGGKRVYAWGLEADIQPTTLRSNTFSMEWPPRSGTMRDFPEVDRAEWFSLDAAEKRILPSQLPLLADLERKLRATSEHQRLFHIDGA